MRLRHIIGCLVSVALLAASLALPAASAAEGDQGPAVRSISAAAGPVAGGIRLRLRGTHLREVAQVTFGSKPGTHLSVSSNSMLQVTTPKHAAGRVDIQLRSFDHHRSSATGAARYTFVMRPVVSRLSATFGPITGGRTVTITGSHFTPGAKVEFGTIQAVQRTIASSYKIVARSPVGVAGQTEVHVVTAGGDSPSMKKAGYTYVYPAPATASSYVASAGTFTPSGDEVVAASGGTRTGSTQEPWEVTLASSVTPPAAGSSFYLAPGSAVLPAGLAGTITTVSTDAPDAVLTVAPSVDSSLDRATVDYTGPTSNQPASVVRPSWEPDDASAPALTSTIPFPKIDMSDTTCDHSVDPTGSLSLTLENVHAHVEVDTGGLFSKPFVEAYVSYETVVTANVSVRGEVKCSVSPEWQNEHTKLFLLSDTGATLAFAPDASFSISASGSVTIAQHSYHTVGFISQPDGTIKSLDAKSADAPNVDASGALDAEAYAGVQIQVGELNVIGAGLSAGIGGKADVEAETAPPQVCISFTPFIRASVYAYLNLWVKEWRLQAFQLEFDLPGYNHCKPLSSAPKPPQLTIWGGNTSYAWSSYIGPATMTLPSGVRSVAFGGDGSWPDLIYDDGSVRPVNVDTSCPWANGKCSGPITVSTTAGAKIAGLGDVTALGNIADDTYALLTNGTVQAWGANNSGQLGDGTTKATSAVVTVKGLSNVVALSSGGGTAEYALLKNGTVMAWGSNGVNELGDGGSEPYATTPQLVPGLSGVVAIAAANQGAFAVLQDGTVMEWGCDAAKTNGKETGGYITPRPTAVPGVSGVVAVAGNTDAAYALTSAGKVWSWGANYDGEVGQGDTSTAWHQPKLLNLSSVATIGDQVAVTTDGHVYTWGDNEAGELGMQNPDHANAPTLVSGLNRVVGLTTNTPWSPLTHAVITNGT